MQAKTPKGKWERSLVAGKTTAKVSGKVMKYLAKKPFLSKDEKAAQKKQLASESAKTIFQSLVLLKGTALKIAQMLSLEKELLPDELVTELEKAYNQIPPMNRVLVGKAVSNAFGVPVNDVFSEFYPKAVAAASLGQVHLAKHADGTKLAVKVQYPGIEKTIQSDLKMISAFLRPFSDYHEIKPSLLELEAHLLKETDYLIEAENLRFFKDNLSVEGVMIPEIYNELTRKSILTTEFIEGPSIDQWLKQNPSQLSRDRIANTIYQIFIKGLYINHTIHADPNPGNFLITKDLQTGLVDFGCIKHFSSTFVDTHKELINKTIHKKEEDYLLVLEKMKVIPKDLKGVERELVFDITSKLLNWYHTLYCNEIFDFGKSHDFLNQGKELFKEFFKYKHFFLPNKNFVFLDRTRYGLFKLFELMGARVRLINKYEY